MVGFGKPTLRKAFICGRKKRLDSRLRGNDRKKWNMNIKLLIDDGLMLARDKPTGIGWYTLNLIKELPSLGIDVRKNNYSEFFKKLPAPVKRVIYVFSSFRNCTRTDVDLIHYTNFYVPPRRHLAKVVVTIHDLTAYRFPDTLPACYRRFNRFSIENAVKFADMILTPSEAVKSELIDKFPHLADEKIKVVYQDIRDLFFNAPKSNLPREHFLYVGMLERRKNLPFLIDTFSRFAQKHKDAKLVLIGKPGFGFSEIKAAIDRSANVVQCDYSADDSLVEKYRKAYALIMPSLYEGFGRPVIEAMAMGLPVIASDISTNSELHNRHGKINLYSNSNAEELIDLLERIFTGSCEMVDYGNLDMYRTSEIARRHMEAYKEICRVGFLKPTIGR